MMLLLSITIGHFPFVGPLVPIRSPTALVKLLGLVWHELGARGTEDTVLILVTVVMELALRIEGAVATSLSVATSLLFIPITIAVPISTMAIIITFVPSIASIGILASPLTLTLSSMSIITVVIIIVIVPLPFLYEGVGLLLELSIPKGYELIKDVSPGCLVQTLVGSIKGV